MNNGFLWEKVFEKSLMQGENQIDSRNVAAGIYLIEIIDPLAGEQILIDKLVKK